LVVSFYFDVSLPYCAFLVLSVIEIYFSNPFFYLDLRGSILVFALPLILVRVFPDEFFIGFHAGALVMNFRKTSENFPSNLLLGTWLL
jgi:hypothetical protein